jgi:hypothetical protein
MVERDSKLELLGHVSATKYTEYLKSQSFGFDSDGESCKNSIGYPDIWDLGDQFMQDNTENEGTLIICIKSISNDDPTRECTYFYVPCKEKN